MALHPFITAMLDMLKDAPALSAGTPGDARAFVAAGRARLGSGPEMHRAEERTIEGRGGPIRARLLMPVARPEGVIVFLHGGGWVVGALEDYETYTRTLAQRTGLAVLAVDYRLAPEAPYPAGLEDCEDALAAVLEGRVDGCPAGPVIVMGDSAGGNLAAVCCARLKDPSAVALQVLYYPVTDHDFDRPSYRAHGTGLPLTARDMQWFFGHYAPTSAWADPDVSPLRRTDLAGLPPAIIVTAEYDVLLDEGEAYADRLAAQGVPVTRRRVDGVTHGFIRLHPLFDIADAELSTISAEIRDRVVPG
ncbi:alpha/beta hydrolase [Seohaeicola zhoushanensis]|uniref:Alpha/beta hydrolase n=1 Tax=Seohaeicola zhoushanensis TaxID=1569283 RepID=A0A8J3H221_9RHOB|nr:alpha/beta hydrolase [Seohaeicola zhoushanensis]GHF67300.1 alpha/beta hydrolase [Seohaeicola zhoushanensis]